MSRIHPEKKRFMIRVDPRKTVAKSCQRTSRSIAAPTMIFAPGAGFCETTMLAGVGCGGGAETEFGIASGDVGGACGDVTDGAIPTFPKRNPASCKTRVTPPSA